eukprot:TRINITY_DN7603_c0_g1_i11.p1 TRINITY_DN7603_c0_g1~~TRINITY_DN7603_c0_g1_i11.p1  ORF type:complete len:717 (+),score=139.18 TRINITY_DN7603_c0_g1_i11:212-2362(+)
MSSDDDLFGDSDDDAPTPLSQRAFMAMMGLRTTLHLPRHLPLHVQIARGEPQESAVVAQKLSDARYGPVWLAEQDATRSAADADVLLVLSDEDAGLADGIQSGTVAVLPETHPVAAGIGPGFDCPWADLGSWQGFLALQWVGCEVNPIGGRPLWKHELGEGWDPQLSCERRGVRRVTVRLTRAEKEAGTLAPSTIDLAIRLVKEEGLCILRGMYSEPEIAAGREAAEADFALCDAALKQRGIELQRPDSNPYYESFYELGMREQRRCDLRNGPAIQRFNSNQGRRMVRHPSLLEIVRGVVHPQPEWSSSLLLGNYGLWNFGGKGPKAGAPEVKVGEFGTVMTLPGAAPQVIHADTPHTHVHVQLPAHYLNLFVPAMAAGAGFECGQSAFVLRSHLLAECAGMMDQREFHVFNPAANGDSELERSLVRPQLEVGDALLFDCRLLHFGLANSSDTLRPLLYCNYTAAYFTDPKNWNDNNRLLRATDYGEEASVEELTHRSELLLEARPLENGVMAHHVGVEEAMLREVETQVKDGDALGVLEAVDSYCYRHHWMMHCGDKKGRVLDAVLNEKLSSHPQGKSVRLLELGVYCGYSGVRMCRQLRPGDQLVSIDIQPESVALADRLLSKAGLRSGVTLIQGTLEELLGPGAMTVRARVRVRVRRNRGPRGAGRLRVLVRKVMLWVRLSPSLDFSRSGAECAGQGILPLRGPANHRSSLSR